MIYSEFPEVRAYNLGRYDARAGLGRDDYPIDYTKAEREAWQRGWDEYHERN